MAPARAKEPVEEPAAKRRRGARWEAALAELRAFQRTEAPHPLGVGDALNRIAEQFGEEAAAQAARAVGIPAPLAAQRRWVSQQLPSGHPVRALLEDELRRKQPRLSYTHLRALAATGPAQARWAQRTVAEALTVRQLKSAIAGEQAECDAEGPRRGRRYRHCAHCGRKLPSVSRTVTLGVGEQEPVRCCGTRCAVAYLSRSAGTDSLSASAVAPSSARASSAHTATCTGSEEDPAADGFLPG